MVLETIPFAVPFHAFCSSLALNYRLCWCRLSRPFADYPLLPCCSVAFSLFVPRHLGLWVVGLLVSFEAIAVDSTQTCACAAVWCGAVPCVLIRDSDCYANG